MKVLHVVLLILCDAFVTVLAQCPIRDESAAQAEDQTRSCRKSCADDPNACTGSRKTCNCDDLCGMSCFNPNGLCPDISLPNGEITYSNGNSYNSEATHQCDRGYYFTGRKTRKCRSNKKWSHSDNIPNCARGCSVPTNLLRFSFITSGKLDGQVGYPVNHVVTYKCRRGYDSEGDPDRTCGSNFLWTTLALTCSPKNCGSPPPINHGSYEINNQTFGGTVTYNCDTGYDLHGTSLFRCFSDGIWEPENSWPTCEARTCMSAVPPENGFLRGGSSGEYGDTVDYYCNAGYKLNGPDSGRCDEKGTWGEVPTCDVDIDATFNLRTLDGYEVVAGSTWSRVRVNEGFEGLPEYLLRGDGTVQSLPYPLTGSQKVCMQAYMKNTRAGELKARASGSKTIDLHTFSATNSWKSEKFWFEPSDPSDETVRLQFYARAGSNVFLDEIKQLEDEECGGCLNPRSNLGYSYITSGKLSGQVGYPVGHVITYRCRTGYDSAGDPDRTCGSDFLWTSLELMCSPKNCGSPPTVSHGSYDINKQTFGGTVTYNCDTGYDLQGTSLFRCLSNGIWEPENSWPTCEARTCMSAVPPENGFLRGRSSREYGDTVNYYCNAGYKLNGPDSGRCKENSTWGEVPTCDVDIDASFNLRTLDGYEVLAGSSWRRVRVDAGFEGLPEYVLRGDGTIQSLSYPLTGDQKVCMQAYIKNTRAGELKAQASGSLTVDLHTFSATGSWKPEKFWFKPSDPSDTTVRLQFYAPAGSNVFLDEIKKLEDEECASVRSTVSQVTTEKPDPCRGHRKFWKVWKCWGR